MRGRSSGKKSEGKHLSETGAEARPRISRRQPRLLPRQLDLTWQRKLGHTLPINHPDRACLAIDRRGRATRNGVEAASGAANHLEPVFPDRSRATQLVGLLHHSCKAPVFRAADGGRLLAGTARAGGAELRAGGAPGFPSGDEIRARRAAWRGSPRPVPPGGAWMTVASRSTGPGLRPSAKC